ADGRTAGTWLSTWTHQDRPSPPLKHRHKKKVVTWRHLPANLLYLHPDIQPAPLRSIPHLIRMAYLNWPCITYSCLDSSSGENRPTLWVATTPAASTMEY